MICNGITALDLGVWAQCLQKKKRWSGAWPHKKWKFSLIKKTFFKLRPTETWQKTMLTSTKRLLNTAASQWVGVLRKGLWFSKDELMRVCFQRTRNVLSPLWLGLPRSPCRSLSPTNLFSTAVLRKTWRSSKTGESALSPVGRSRGPKNQKTHSLKWKLIRISLVLLEIWIIFL